MSVVLVDKLIRLTLLKHDLEREFNMQGFLTKTQDAPERIRRACPPGRMPERRRPAPAA
jgi:hypothetical protein